MILSKEEILKEIKKGKIKIEPFNIDSLAPCSYELTLDNEFAFPNKKEIILDGNVTFKENFKSKILTRLKLKPGDFILGITKEKITLSEGIAALLSGRTRYARLGLQVHSSADFINPGISNKQVFEIKNIGKNTLVLEPGLKIGQIIFLEVKGKSDYQGIFKNQDKIV